MVEWLAAREEFPMAGASKEEMMDYRDTFHPLIHPYLNYRDSYEEEKWRHGSSMHGSPQYHGYIMEDITENGEKGTGLEEMCWVFEGQVAGSLEWVNMNICKFCGEIKEWVGQNSDEIRAKGGANLSGFQVCDNDECRAEALLTGNYAIEQNLNIESGHRIDCDKDCCAQPPEDYEEGA